MSNGLVFVGSGGGVLYAYDPDATDGQRTEWTYEIESAITSSPVVYDGTVYVGANDGTVHAVNTDSSKAWDSATEVGAAVYSTVATGSNRVFVTTNTGDLVALDRETGVEDWRFKTNTELGASSPTVADGAVYIGATNVYALDAATGEELWDDPFRYGGTAGSTPTVKNGVVYVGSSDNNLYALDSADGGKFWTYEADASIATSPAVTDGQIAFASIAGTVYLLDDSGMELARKSVGTELRSSPVLSEYEIFLGSDDGRFINLSLGIDS